MAERRLVSNKWEIIRVIGHGGMGSVYEVRHTTLEIRRALKTLHPHLADDPEIVRRFLREGRNEARLEHPNIVRVYDFDTDPEFGAYLTMEMVEGRDLKMRMQQGPLSLREVLRIGSEVAAALDYAHSAVPPIVHRDIKPANILLSDKTGSAKVTDFGIAKELADRETGVTGTQGFIGTIRYAAPEQVRADVDIDARVDLYSLGVVLYEMYSGKIFLDGVTPADIYRRTMMDLDWQPPMVFPSPPPEEFAEVVRWCLQRQRANRIPSAREIVKCLHVCVETGAEHVQYQPVQSGGESPTVAPDLAALSEPTAATVVSLVVEEDSTTIVGLRARIMRFRQELDPEVATFSHLYAEATALGVPTTGVALPDDFSERLTGLDEEVDGALDSRDRERLAHLFSRFEQLREEFVVGTGELRRRLADGIATAVANVQDAWRTLTDAGGAAVSPEARAAFDTLLQRTRVSTEAADWQAGRETLSQARALLEQTRAAFVQQAEATVAELFSQAAPVVEELQGYLGADATPEVDLVVVQSAVAADLAAGRADAAIGRARDAVEQARRELERRRGEAQELLAQQRDAAEGALRSVDAETAERIAPEDFRRASEALAAAREAETQNQLVLAAEHYRGATESLERVRTRIAAQQAAELEQRLQAEREAAQGAEKAAAALAAVMESLDVEGAQSVAAADLAAARELEAGARAFRQRREWAAATAGFDAARQAFIQLQERVVRELAPQLAAASDDLGHALEAAAAAPAIVVGAARERAEAALVALRSAPPSAGIAAARAAVAALEQALQEGAAYRSATEQRAATEALHGRVNQLGLGRRQLRSVEQLTKDAAAAFDCREWTQARDAYAQLHAQLETLER
jgi:tRNA A-37 threonylcarbamoyl transferase component Bud32